VAQSTDSTGLQRRGKEEEGMGRGKGGWKEWWIFLFTEFSGGWRLVMGWNRGKCWLIVWFFLSYTSYTHTHPSTHPSPKPTLPHPHPQPTKPTPAIALPRKLREKTLIKEKINALPKTRGEGIYELMSHGLTFLTSLLEIRDGHLIKTQSSHFLKSSYQDNLLIAQFPPHLTPLSICKRPLYYYINELTAP